MINISDVLTNFCIFIFLALFLVDVVHEMYLWQGWWPGNPEESESATTTGSAEFRWHRDRKLAMQSVQSYADCKSKLKKTPKTFVNSAY